MIRKFALSLMFAGLQLAAVPACADTLNASGGVRIVVPAHDIGRGDVITDHDLTINLVPGGALMSGVVTNMEAVKGLEARRVLHAGEAIRTEDVRRPVVVTKGQTVTMLFQAPGVELSAMGRAMSEGGVGDTVTIQNPASFRMISGVVSAPGTVIATGPASPSPMQRTARK
jgi:flagella basal body P-ring formation protein FlgA